MIHSCCTAPGWRSPTSEGKATLRIVVSMEMSRRLPERIARTIHLRGACAGVCMGFRSEVRTVRTGGEELQGAGAPAGGCASGRVPLRKEVSTRWPIWRGAK